MSVVKVLMSSSSVAVEETSVMSGMMDAMRDCVVSEVDDAAASVAAGLNADASGLRVGSMEAQRVANREEETDGVSGCGSKRS